MLLAVRYGYSSCARFEFNCYRHLATHVTKLCEIRRQIDRTLDAWEAWEHKMLVEDTARTCAQYFSISRGEGIIVAQGEDIP